MPDNATSSAAQTLPAYAGIGSRATPPAVLDLMTRAACWLSGQGWVLRTGMATGADQAFYRGSGTRGALELYLPWPSSRQAPVRQAAAQDSSCSASLRQPPTSSRPRFTPRGRGCRGPSAHCTHATAIRCSAPTCEARHASSCAGRLTVASTVEGGTSAGPDRRCVSPTTTASPCSTSPAPSICSDSQTQQYDACSPLTHRFTKRKV